MLPSLGKVFRGKFHSKFSQMTVYLLIAQTKQNKPTMSLAEDLKFFIELAFWFFQRPILCGEHRPKFFAGTWQQWTDS
jgi:hypothetical protein